MKRAIEIVPPQLISKAADNSQPRLLDIEFCAFHTVAFGGTAFRRSLNVVMVVLVILRNSSRIMISKCLLDA